MKALNGLFAKLSLALLLASVVTGAAHSRDLPASQTTRANAPSWFNTPFGVIYKVHGRETVSYAPKHPAGTIVVSNRERYLYYVLGNGTAMRYSIGIGQEGSAWAGVSTISAKREWPDWSPTPNIKKKYPNLPNHMKGGEGNPLGARALISAILSIAFTARTSPGGSVTPSRRDASASPTTTLSTCTAVQKSAGRLLCKGDPFSVSVKRWSSAKHST